MVMIFPKIKHEGKSFSLQILVIFSEPFHLVALIQEAVIPKVSILIVKIRKLKIQNFQVQFCRLALRVSVYFRSVLIVPILTELHTDFSHEEFSVDPEQLVDLLDHILSFKNRQNINFLWDLIHSEIMHPYEILFQIVKLINNIMRGDYLIAPNIPHRHFFTEQYFIGQKLEKLLFVRESIMAKMEYNLQFDISDKWVFMQYVLDNLLWDIKYIYTNPLERPCRVPEIEEIIKAPAQQILEEIIEPPAQQNIEAIIEPPAQHNLEEIIEPTAPAQHNLEEIWILDSESEAKRSRFSLPKIARIFKRKANAKIKKFFSHTISLRSEIDDCQKEILDAIIAAKEAEMLEQAITESEAY